MLSSPGPERAANFSSSDDDRPARNSPERKSGPAPTMLRTMRRQLRNRLLRSRHKKAASSDSHAEQVVAEWLDKTENGSAVAAPVVPVPVSDAVTLVEPSQLEDELDADVEFDEDEMSSVMGPLLKRHMIVHEPLLPTDRPQKVRRSDCHSLLLLDA